MDSPARLLQNLLLAAKKLVQPSRQSFNPAQRGAHLGKKALELFLIPLLLLPLVFVMGYLLSQNLRLTTLEESINNLERKELKFQQRRGEQEQRWTKAQKSSPYYVAQAIESLSLLAPEQRRMQALARQYPENSVIRERLLFLLSDKNRIRFIKTAERAGPFFQERELRMQNPVQMNEEDLKKFLSTVEGKPDTQEAQPVLIIKNFTLKKQREKTEEAVYSIQAEILQRTP